MNREVIIVLGKTGFGKSLWSKLYTKSVSRQLIYDPSMTFPTRFYPIEDIAAEITGRIDEYSNPINEFSYGTYDTDGVGVLGHLSFTTSHNLLLIEECANVFEKGLRKLPEWAKRLCFFGRHRACSILLIAQRAASIPIDFRSQANRIVTFQQHENDDVGWLKDFFGTDVESMPYLPKWSCLDYHNGQVIRYSIKERAEAELGITLVDTSHADLAYMRDFQSSHEDSEIVDNDREDEVG